MRLNWVTLLSNLTKKFKNKQPPKKYVKDDLIEGDAEDIDEKK